MARFYDLEVWTIIIEVLHNNRILGWVKTTAFSDNEAEPITFLERSKIEGSCLEELPLYVYVWFKVFCLQKMLQKQSSFLRN